MKTLTLVSTLMLGTLLTGFALSALLYAPPSLFDSRATLLGTMLVAGLLLLGLCTREIHRLYKSLQHLASA